MEPSIHFQNSDHKNVENVPVKKLTLLDLLSNGNSSIQFIITSGQDKSSFRSIEFMNGCEMVRLEFNIFKSYDSIEKLTLSSIGLESLRLQDFTYAENFEKLNVSHNKLTEIPAMVFVNAPKITEVNFSSNQISRIDPMALETFEQNSNTGLIK